MGLRLGCKIMIKGWEMNRRDQYLGCEDGRFTLRFGDMGSV